ncbi:HAL3 domain protein [Cryptosporidium felis]|nr:HAL3 domain protein [Cryptosporidium felis]
MNKKKVLIGVTGSVAAIKIQEFIEKLRLLANESGFEVDIKVVATSSAKNFIDKLSPHLEAICENEFSTWKTIGDDILHISLRKWADLYIILPLTANTLGKLSNGLCDNILTNVARAWDFRKPILACPAMNTLMWEHPVTMKQIEALKSFGYQVILPIEKKLACGEFGVGGMQQVEEIARRVVSKLKALKGE